MTLSELSRLLGGCPCKQLHCLVPRCATVYYSDGRPLYVVRALQHRSVTNYLRGVCSQVLAYENMFGSRRMTYVLFVCQLCLHARHILYLSCATDRASCVSQNVHLQASHCPAHVESRLAQPRTCSFQEYMFGCIPYIDAVAVVLSDYVTQTEPPHRAYVSAVFHFTEVCMPGPRAPDRQALTHG